MENASGENLTEFFNDWIYNQGFPSYQLEWRQPNPSQISISISQTQSHASVSYFEAPIPIRVLGTHGEQLDLILDNTANNEIFLRSVNFIVDTVLLDPEADLISKNNSVSLNIDTVAMENQLQVYPNPTSQILHISKPNSMRVHAINIYNTLGQLMLTTPWTDTIDLSSYSSGMFFVQLETNRGIINKSVLKN
ncbi:MAG: T9SS type A sorting domain-containing protein [Xanthomarina sp.]